MTDGLVGIHFETVIVTTTYTATQYISYRFTSTLFCRSTARLQNQLTVTSESFPVSSVTFYIAILRAIPVEILRGGGMEKIIDQPHIIIVIFLSTTLHIF